MEHLMEGMPNDTNHEVVESMPPHPVSDPTIDANDVVSGITVYPAPGNEVAEPSQPEEVNHELQEHSRVAISVIHDAYVEQAVQKGQFKTAEDAELAIQREAESIRDNHALTINMSVASIAHLREVGAVEPFWTHFDAVGSIEAIAAEATANGKSMRDEYVDYRRTADDALRTYAPDNATAYWPVFTAVAGPRETKSGAAPTYGNWHVVLDESLNNRAVYNFSDSHASVTRNGQGELTFNDATVLDYSDAIEAKAITSLFKDYYRSLGLADDSNMLMGNFDPSALMTINGHEPAYVEGAVFDKVGVDLVTVVHANVNTTKQLYDAAEILGNPGSLEGKIQVDCGDAIDPLTKSWISQWYKSKDTVAPEGDTDMTAVWDELGVSPDTPYAEVCSALHNRRKELEISLRSITSGLGRHSGMPGFYDKKWNEYFSTYSDALDKAGIEPAAKEGIMTLRLLHQASNFFIDPHPPRNNWW